MSVYSTAKRVVLGRPLESDQLDHERLNKRTALAVLSSDAISSVAYATDQILFVLGGALGAAALSYVLPISAIIVGLLILIGVSYQQTIRAYPSGGGSYTVAHENLGAKAGLVAAAALLTDYILTVAVSVSGGVAAITSAYPALKPHTVAIGLIAITVLMLVNLRGVRESGVAFSLPTYLFIGMMLLLIGSGLWQVGTGTAVPALPPDGTVRAALDPHGVQGFALVFLLMRGFAEGCAAMTGTEAISNGVQAFRAPSQRNAAITLAWMVAILATFFLGVSWLASTYHIMPTSDETVLSRLGHAVLGTGPLYYGLQYSTFAVLVLAANTAFADFPRLGSILAHDDYLPKQLAARGDRLAFSNGIISLALVAMTLVWLFRGDTNALVPLYAVGVFVCFTLSQAGMVVHWLHSRAPGWRWRATLNGLGALATGIVSIIQVATKFLEGAWIVVILIPMLIVVLQAINVHYRRFRIQLAFRGRSPMLPTSHHVVVPISALNKATSAALVYAAAISSNVHVVHVGVDESLVAKLEREWDRWDVGYELEVLSSPYRSVLRPLIDYVDRLQEESPGAVVTIVTSEIVPRHWWQLLLHNKTALYVRTAFLLRQNVVVIAVPFLVGVEYEHAGSGPRWVPDSTLFTAQHPVHGTGE